MTSRIDQELKNFQGYAISSSLGASGLIGTVAELTDVV